MNNTISWDYPEELFDVVGYPTPQSLDYLKNWSIIIGNNSEFTKFGKYFSEGEYEKLISYILELWWGDGVKYKDGLLELHTGGWSGNEEIIDELKNTNLWLQKLRIQQAGGHYFFRIDGDSELDWLIVKNK